MRRDPGAMLLGGRRLRSAAALPLFLLLLLLQLGAVSATERFLEEEQTLAPTELGSESGTDAGTLAGTETGTWSGTEGGTASGTGEGTDADETDDDDEPWDLDDDDDPWPIGTPIYREFEGDGWYYGYISDYDAGEGGLYTITYEDESSGVFRGDDEALGVMVRHGANYEPYEKGCGVFDALRPMAGLIQEFHDFGYEILWDDGSTTLETHLRDVDDWVDALKDGNKDSDYSAPTDAAEEQPGSGPLEIGTFVIRKDPDGTDRYGFLVDYTNGSYLVLYESGQTEWFPQDSPDLAALLENAKAYEPYPVGTQVEKDTLGGDVLRGTVHSYENGEYTVVWSNLSRESLPIHAIDDLLSDGAVVEEPSPEEFWEPGTLAFALVEDGLSVLAGVITGYDATNHTYTVSYEDGSEATYEENSDELLLQVSVGKTYQPLPVGTPVLGRDGKPGTVQSFEDGPGQYTIKWYGGSIGHFGIGPVTDMAERAKGGVDHGATPAPTEAGTEGTTEETTEAATEATTEAATEAATESTTEKATEAATPQPTAAATPQPTAAATPQPTQPPVPSPTKPSGEPQGSANHDEEEELTMLFGLVKLEPGSSLYEETPERRALVQGIFLLLVGLLICGCYCCCCRCGGRKQRGSADMGQYRQVAAFSEDGFLDEHDIEMIHQR